MSQNHNLKVGLQNFDEYADVSSASSEVIWVNVPVPATCQDRGADVNTKQYWVMAGLLVFFLTSHATLMPFIPRVPDLSIFMHTVQCCSRVRSC